MARAGRIAASLALPSRTRSTAVVSILAVAGVAAVTTSTADSASSSDAVAYRTLQSGMLVGFYDDAQIYSRNWAFKQLRRPAASSGSRSTGRPLPSDAAEARRPSRQGLQLDGRRPRDLEGGREQGPRPRDDLRDSALGRQRQKPSPSPHDRPAPLLARRGSPLQRHVPRRDSRERACAPPGRPPLARVERAEQPCLPEAAVEAVRGGWRPQSAFDYAKICSAVWAESTRPASPARRSPAARRARAATTPRAAPARPPRRSSS